MRIKLVALSVVLLVSLVACAPDYVPSDYRPPVSTRVSAAPTAVATAVPETTPEGVPSAVKAVQDALKSNDIAQLSSLMLGSVWIGEDGNEAQGDTVSREDALSWLKTHWAKPAVGGSNYVRDSGLLSLSTTGWKAQAPVTQGSILLNMHRYDDLGNMDDAQGQWKIDTILYH